MHIIVIALHRPTDPTGVCRHAANLARCLAQTEEVRQITLVTGIWQQHYFKELLFSDARKINVLGIDIKNTSGSRNFWFLFGLPNLIRELHPDLVHLSFPLPFFRWLFTCPVVTTIHDLYPYKIPENFGKKQALFNKIFLQQCIRNSDALTCVSQITLNDLKQYFPEVISKAKHTQVVYNFVDFDRIEIEQPKLLKNKVERPFILCVGQHRKNKNFDLLIQAYALLRKERRIDVEMSTIVVGSPGPETENLMQSIHTLSLQDSVLMLSAINDNELCWLYQNCQLMVIPSSIEGFCIPLVEALYFSCKVVCSDIPIFREIGSSACTYFNLKGNTVKNLAESINCALETDADADKYDYSRFTKAEIARQYLNFYLKLM
ncbi:glycosyltransferase family 4 protein [Chamaesiphon polymorphus]|uniref:Glycosyltransferase family 1 protein n=1 Tax=Chamaesiphon polymorphus CCALA 037 TaxID=2107692 RepID=A0A2T1GMV6_9CYAN|nr:glycosyltransferase family 1 protein [Chamaesiphon polymorphus]PSB59251.1 glycosyltransferase family 1 protein [Chamaesiphon polymorphus CCALA 037]